MCGRFIGLICFNTNMDNIENLEGEIWKDIKDWEGIYRISNKGRLASNKSGKWNVLSNVNSKGGYFSVVLKYNGKKRYARIHRLVYETFVGVIPNGKRYHIHHKDGNKQNNILENLELVDCSIHHSIHIKENHHLIEGMIRYNKYEKTNPISQFDLNGNFIKTYLNGKDASDATGVCQRNILQVANKEPFNKKGNIRKQAGGFIWRFAKS